VTFVPSFLFIFLGAPYIERLRNNRALAGALTGITAAVVGVIANLAVYFAINTLFAATRTLDAGLLALLPDPTTLRPVPLIIGVLAGRAVRRPLAGPARPRRRSSPRPRCGAGRTPGELIGDVCRCGPYGDDGMSGAASKR